MAWNDTKSGMDVGQAWSDLTTAYTEAYKFINAIANSGNDIRNLYNSL